MARGARVQATTSFVFENDGTTVDVHAGDVSTSTNAAVKKHRELFESKVQVEGPTEASGEKTQR